jgi:pectin methylesterase-like acyl-CoA thioesterase
MPFGSLRPLLVALFLLGGPCGSMAATYAVGTCLPQYFSFGTIQSAVSSVPAGSMIKVCSGTYSEQVTITQPITLEGVAVSNTDRAVITVPPNGFSVNANFKRLANWLRRESWCRM